MARRGFLKRRRNDLVYLCALCGWALAVVLPRRLGLSLFGTLGRVVYAFGGVDRRRTLLHLRMVYGDTWPEERIQRTARDVYANIGKNLFDSVRVPRMSERTCNRTVRANSLTSLREASDAGKGYVLITAHLGCFELLLPYFNQHGIHGFAVGQKLFDPRIDAMVARSRRKSNRGYVSRADNAREIIRKLREGLGLGVLIDQDTAVEGVFAHFLGRLAYTPCGAVRLAMKRSLPLFVATDARQPDNTHFVTISGPLQLHGDGPFEADLVRAVESINTIISDAIHRTPEQWVWMHRRWRRQPGDAKWESAPNIECLTRGA